MTTITLENIQELDLNNSLVFLGIGVGDTFVGDEFLSFIRKSFPKEHLKFRTKNLNQGENLILKNDENTTVYISTIKEFSNQSIENPDQIMNYVEEVLDHCQVEGITTIISNQLVHTRDNFTELEVLDEITAMIKDYEGIKWYYHKED